MYVLQSGRRLFWTVFCTSAVVLLLCLWSPGTALADDKAHEQGSASGPLPPNAIFRGQSLRQWLKDYWTWFISTTDPNALFMENGVLFMPLPQENYHGGSGTYNDPVTATGHVDITIRAGTPFVLPVIVWLGSIDPNTGVWEPVFPDEWFGGRYINGPVTLDGRPILREFDDYYVSPAYFDEQFQSEYYFKYAQGVGFVCRPLAPGVHRLTNGAYYSIPPGVYMDPLAPSIYTDGLGLIFDNSWTITVIP